MSDKVVIDGFSTIEPVHGTFGLREGGDQVTISNTGLITFGSGVYAKLGLESNNTYRVTILEDVSTNRMKFIFSKDFIDTRKEYTEDQIKVHESSGRTRKGRKMNCTPILSGMENKTIGKLISQKPIKEGSTRVPVPSITCKQHNKIDKETLSVIITIPKSLPKRSS